MLILCDIDGTVADHSHRLQHVTGKKKDFKTFNSLIHLDKPKKAMIEVLNTLFDAHMIFMVTGREEVLRQGTMAWLYDAEVPFHKLYMRPIGDYRADDIIKQEMLKQMWEEGYSPEMVYDDRPSVCRMWRKNGLICCQLNDVEF